MTGNLTMKKHQSGILREPAWVSIENPEVSNMKEEP
jgi:hypothetical protein